MICRYFILKKIKITLLNKINILTNLPSHNHSYLIFARVSTLKVANGIPQLWEYTESMLIHITLLWDPVVTGSAWLLRGEGMIESIWGKCL